MADEMTAAAAEMARAVEARGRVIRTTRMHGACQLIAGAALMVVSAVQTKNGQNGATWAVLGVAFLAFSTATFGRARQLDDARKQRLLDGAIADAVKQGQGQQD